MTHTQQFLQEVAAIASAIDYQAVERIATRLAKLREDSGRLFILGVGGSAANSSHAVGDFRKLANIEAYAPSDNIAELTARTNDEGWDTVFAAWLRTSHANKNDAVLVLSVGGGDAERNISPNIVLGLDEAKRSGLAIFGIVGRDGGYTKRIGDEVIVVPEVEPDHVTPHSESFQSIVWHCLVFHPSLLVGKSKWENVAG